MKHLAVIVSAGKGRRMGTEQKKQFLCLKKIPVLSRTLMAFDRCEKIDAIILVVPKADRVYCRKKILAPLNISKPIHMAEGGEERQDSVFNGLQKVLSIIERTDNVIVLVHDGVRPFVDADLINDAINHADKYGAAVPCIGLTDTVKLRSDTGFIEKTLDREKLFCAQTPQAFKLNLLRDAFDYANQTRFKGTDDASLVEHLGHEVFITKGSRINIKITTPEDLVVAEQIIKTFDLK